MAFPAVGRTEASYCDSATIGGIGSVTDTGRLQIKRRVSIKVTTFPHSYAQESDEKCSPDAFQIAVNTDDIDINSFFLLIYFLNIRMITNTKDLTVIGVLFSNMHLLLLFPCRCP